MTTEQDQGQEPTAPEGTPTEPATEPTAPDATPPEGDATDVDKGKPPFPPPKPKPGEEEEDMSKAAGKVEAGLKSIAQRANAALAQIKDGKVPPSVMAMVMGIAADAKALAGKADTTKAEQEFNADQFNAWVQAETAAIMAEPDDLMKALRTQSLGESVQEFRKAVSSLEDKVAGTVKVKVFMDPMRGAAEPTPPKTVKFPGTPGKPKGVMKGEDQDGGDPAPDAEPPATDDPPAEPPAEPVTKGDPEPMDDGMDDGDWPMDMGTPPTKVGKAADAAQVDVVNRRPGMIGDMNTAEDTLDSTPDK